MRERLYLSLLISVLLCLAGWTAHAQLTRSAPARQTWEYKAITLARTTINENWSYWVDDDKTLPRR
jgi:hypothetical protein